MATKAQLTTNVFEEQDKLGRAYATPNNPTRDKDRLGDLWVVETATKEVPDSGASYPKINKTAIRSLSKISKFRRRRR